MIGSIVHGRSVGILIVLIAIVVGIIASVVAIVIVVVFVVVIFLLHLYFNRAPNCCKPKIRIIEITKPNRTVTNKDDTKTQHC